MTFLKTLSPNIGGTFENHQNISLFPLLVWILRVVSKHNYVNKWWNSSIYFWHFHYYLENVNLTRQFSLFWGGQRSKNLREIDRDDNNLTVNSAFLWIPYILVSKFPQKLRYFDGGKWRRLAFSRCQVKKVGNSYPKLREIGGSKVLTWSSKEQIGLLL